MTVFSRTYLFVHPFVSVRYFIKIIGKKRISQKLLLFFLNYTINQGIGNIPPEIEEIHKVFMILERIVFGFALKFSDLVHSFVPGRQLYSNPFIPNQI